jgi:endonuclease-8
MPEGDTLFRAARTLASVLEGKSIVRVHSPLAALEHPRLVGRRIDRVEARGKNLLMRFDDGRMLRTHLRMHGSWHVYRTGERWQRAAWRARLVLEVEGFVAVCFDAPVVELSRASIAEQRPALAALGPDILTPDFDHAEARRRLRALPDRELGDAILEQRALAGIGNIYKSETLFVCRADPFAKVASLEDAELDRVIAEARTLMLRNIEPGRRMRTTRMDAPRARFHVYGRSGAPCFACGAAIRMRRQGEAARSTYFCPSCQAPRAS